MYHRDATFGTEPGARAQMRAAIAAALLERQLRNVRFNDELPALFAEAGFGAQGGLTMGTFLLALPWQICHFQSFAALFAKACVVPIFSATLRAGHDSNTFGGLMSSVYAAGPKRTMEPFLSAKSRPWS